MDEEIKANFNDTLKLVIFPKCYKLIDIKWVYKIKNNASGEIEKHEVSLVVKCYSLKIDIDYDEVFAVVNLLD